MLTMGANPKRTSSGPFTGLMALCLALILATSASRLSASEGIADIAQLLQAGVGADVLMGFVDRSQVAYQPTAEEIVYLQDLGASDALIQELIKHGAALAPPEAAAQAAPVAAEPEPPVTAAAVATPPPDDVNVSFFYEALAPYGKWRSVDGAWVWQPTAAIVDHGWRPYLGRGHWVNSDWGWAWHSDYTWGWAPFHYGRWSRVGAYGWVWTPDTTWGPAWVNWRMDDTNCGWAPLPPRASYQPDVGLYYDGSPAGPDCDFGLCSLDYCFVPVEYFCEPALPVYAISPTRVVNIFKKTRIIGNNYGHANHHIVNQGPSPERIQQAAGRPIKQVKIVDAPVRPGQPLHGETLLKDKLTVFRPAVRPVATTTPQEIIAKQEAAKKPAANRIPVQVQQPKQPVLQTRRDEQMTATSAQAQKFAEAQRLAKAQQDKLSAERTTAAEAARQARTNQEAEAKRQQLQRENEARQEAAVAQRKSQAAAEAAAHEQARREAVAQREPVATPHRTESVQQPQIQSHVQFQTPVRSQLQEQPRPQIQSPVRSQPQAQPQIQVHSAAPQQPGRHA